MIWIILGVLPIVGALTWVLFNDPEGFFILIGLYLACILMVGSITYGMYQVFG